MKVLLLGKNGQVGWELQRSLSILGDVVALGRSDIDLTDHNGLRARIQQLQPNVIVNAAAYTAVDKAETEPNEARQINVDAVGVLASQAAITNAWLVHYSTDYVFNGEKNTPYVEDDQAEPLNTYGQTKIDGEGAIRTSGCKHLILRSSWVYSTRGGNFPLAILRQALERDHLDVVNDCFGAPTSAQLISTITTTMLYRISVDLRLSALASGTYHLAASGETSWYDYAKVLVSIARNRGLPIKAIPNKIFPIRSSENHSRALRPKNSRLDTTKLCTLFDLTVPNWKDQIELFIDEIIKLKLI